MEKLKYTSESDRAYGATGMAIGLVIYDGDDMLASVDLDAAPNDMVALSPDFYFAGNPGVSAKTAWNQILKNYNLGISMLMANVLCRHLVARRADVPEELVGLLRSLACGEGRQSCELDEDEVNRLFDKNYTYLRRVFSHHGVQSVAHDFAATLISRRSLSRHDVLEQLSALNML